MHKWRFAFTQPARSRSVCEPMDVSPDRREPDAGCAARRRAARADGPVDARAGRTRRRGALRRAHRRAAPAPVRGGAPAGAPGRRRGARRLRPPAPLPAFRCRHPAGRRRADRGRRRAVSDRRAAPAVGPRPHRRPSGARDRRLRAASRPTTPSSSSRWSTRGRSPAIARCSIASPRLFRRWDTHAHLLDALQRLAGAAARAVQRHALPARAGRQRRAGRAARSDGAPHARTDHRSGAARPDRRPIARVSTRPRTSCCACGRCCISKRSAITTCSATSCRRRRRRRSGIPAPSRSSASSG